MRNRLLPLLLSLAVLPACLFGHDHDEPDDLDDRGAEVLDDIRRQLRLEDDLSELTGGTCRAQIGRGSVDVRVLPGARGLPDAAMLRRMSERITLHTGLRAEHQIIRTVEGRVLFANGAIVGN
jgi:hypothetical protein